jgi:hypothetical protein
MFPFAIPLIKAGIGLGASALGGQLSRQRLSPAEEEAQRNAARAGRIGINAGGDLLSMGAQAYNPVVNYLSQILSGQGGALTSAAGPEISRIGQGYGEAARTSAALNPRGGPSAEFNAELPFMQQRDITQLIQGLRPQAAGQLGGAAGNILGNAINALYLGTNAGRGVLESEQMRRQREAQRGEAIGASIFDLIDKHGFDAILKMFQRSGGGGGGDRRYNISIPDAFR